MATQLTKDDLAFFAEHADIGQTLQQGWARGLTRDVKNRFEDIYRRHIDKDFHLQRNCTACVVAMLTKLFTLHEPQTAEEPAEPKQTKAKAKKGEPQGEGEE